MRKLHLLFAITLATTACATTQETTASNTMTQQQFIDEMNQKHGFDVETISKQLALATHQESIIAAMTRPAEAMPWHKYRNIFIQQDRINGGVDFLNTYRGLLQRAESEYGVDPYIITAIIGVETRYGGNTGSYRVIDALKTLAFGYPKRADFFRGQLEEFFLMAREEGIDPMQPKGSYAGAMGMPQFIPSSFRAYAIDFDGDKHRDLWNNPADVIGSVANYFAVHGWRKGEPVARKLSSKPMGIEPGSRRGQQPNLDQAQLIAANIKLQDDESSIEHASLIELEQESSLEYWLGFNNFYVITRYNHSNLYAMAVFQLAEAIRDADKSPNQN